MNNSILITLTASMLGMGACKPRVESKYEIKHTFSNTSITRPTPPEPCKNSDQTKPEWQYVSAMVDYITAKNPETFQGHLDRKYICVKIGQPIKMINAAMDGANGTIILFPRLLKVKGLDTDAGLASTLAHELAHFTMSHHLSSRGKPAPAGYDLAKEKTLQAKIDVLEKEYENKAVEITRTFVSDRNGEVPRIIDDISTNQQLIERHGKYGFPQKLQDALEQFNENLTQKTADTFLNELSSSLRSAQDIEERRPGSLTPQTKDVVNAVLNRHDSLFDSITPLAKRVYSAKSDLEMHQMPLIQRDEQEADEVGFEFYVRAGFEPKLYAQSFIALAKSQNQKLNCQHVTSTSQPPRYREGISFNKQHPDFCWRYFDLKYTEREKHAKDYAAFTPKKPIVNLPQMERLRAALPATYD